MNYYSYSPDHDNLNNIVMNWKKYQDKKIECSRIWSFEDA